MKINALLLLALFITGCTKQYTINPVPEFLTTPVAEPHIPEPATATQRDVAIFITEQHEALQICNTKLQIIRKWNNQWTSQTKPKH